MAVMIFYSERYCPIRSTEAELSDHEFLDRFNKILVTLDFDVNKTFNVFRLHTEMKIEESGNLTSMPSVSDRHYTTTTIIDFPGRHLQSTLRFIYLHRAICLC